MAGPTRPSFVCRECGHRAPKWLGRCPECEAWNSFAQQSPAPALRVGAGVPLVPYTEISTAPGDRRSTTIPELDRVLGGGLVPGAVVLLGGEPGIGKSTLLLQMASRMAAAGQLVLYVSGEESASQLRARGDRLGVSSADLLVACSTDVDAVIRSAHERAPAVLVVDSVQAVRVPGLDGVPGSVSQVRESASRLLDYAKSTDTPTFLVGHVTKDGALAGPRALEHLVDTVIQFEGDRYHDHRTLRVLKNRFGPTHELGIFRMTETGLEEVANPSELFLSERTENLPGSAVLAAVEGTRPLLVEIQALVGEPSQGSPRRTCLGVDSNRVALVLAVLQRRTGIELSQRDVFVNVTGGLTLLEPASDLAVALAVASSALNRALPPAMAAVGEIGLTGEIRAVTRMDLRLREAARLGFTRIVTPTRGLPHARPSEALRLLSARRVEDVCDAVLGEPQIG